MRTKSDSKATATLWRTIQHLDDRKRRALKRDDAEDYRACERAVATIRLLLRQMQTESTIRARLLRGQRATARLARELAA